jgi:undecaprenyl-diphosphatase
MLNYYIVAAAQIVLESLPISSSTHVALLERMVGAVPFPSYMMYLLHIPTVCMLGFFFRTQIMSLVRTMIRNWHLGAKLCFLIGIVDGITVCAFVLLHVAPICIPVSVGIISTALMLYGVQFCTPGTQRFDVVRAVILGVAQSIALLPGVSRFATVYASARFLGISHRRAFEITWLCAAPLFIAPVLLVFFKNIDLSGAVSPIFGVTILGATILSYYVLWLVEQLTVHNYLWILSIYMIVPLVLSFLIM